MFAWPLLVASVQMNNAGVRGVSLATRNYEQANLVMPMSDIGIERLYVINLDSQPEKMDDHEMMESLDALPYPCSRWRGAEPGPGFASRVSSEFRSMLSESLERILQKADRGSFDDEKRGVLGCYLSHYSIIHHIAKTGKPGKLYMVIEDSTLLSQTLPALLPTIISKLSKADPAWSALRLDCSATPKKYLDRGLWRTSPDNCKERVQCYGGAKAIIYNWDAIESLVHHFRTPKFEDADQVFWTHDSPTYCMTAGVVTRHKLANSSYIHRRRTNCSSSEGSPFKKQ